MSKPITFGTPADVNEGDWFRDHDELYAKDVHRGRGRGIAGTASQGVDSIVMSGGYVDDEDRGDEILYTGEGGRDSATCRLIDDQTFDSRGNAGLIRNHVKGYPVRVVEGLVIKGKKRRRVTGGYRYRGLYRVADYWMTEGKEGFRICQFRLVKLAEGTTALPHSDVSPSGESEDAVADTLIEEELRRYISQQRLVRDSAVVRRIKQMYDHTCQMCGLRLVVSPTGEAYSEAAHIQAVGKPHNGPDKLENVLCLCPNCHVLFDRGALQLSDSLDVLDGLTQKNIAQLRRVQQHRIQTEFVRRHRERWADRRL